MSRNYASTSVTSSLATDVSSGATSLPVASMVGFPQPPFFAALDRSTPANREVVLVTAADGPSYTVARQQDGTTAKAHLTGVTFEHVTTATDHIEAAQAADGYLMAPGVL